MRKFRFILSEAIKTTFKKLNKEKYLLSKGDNYLLFELMQNNKFADIEDIKIIIKEIFDNIKCHTFFHDNKNSRLIDFEFN